MALLGARTPDVPSPLPGGFSDPDRAPLPERPAPPVSELAATHPRGLQKPHAVRFVVHTLSSKKELSKGCPN